MLPEIPPHPFGFKCETCENWRKDLAQRCVVMPDGKFLPVRDLIMQGKSPKAEDVTTLAVCQLHPVWSTTPSNHYCNQHTAPRPLLDN